MHASSSTFALRYVLQAAKATHHPSLPPSQNPDSFAENSEDKIPSA